MVPPEANTNAASAASFSALAQTDEQGRYRLEGVPAGRYYIVAGRVDLPTYFPGTSDISNARIFSIAPGGAVSGIDFVMMDTSIRTISSSELNSQLQAGITIPVQVRLEGSAKLPVFTAGAFTGVLFTDVASGVDRAQRIQNAFAFDLGPLSSTAEYKVKVVNLPEGYVVRTMTYDAMDVLTNTVKIPPSFLLRPTLITVNGITQVTGTSAQATVQARPELIITLASVPAPAAAGVRVTGRETDIGVRSVYISGTPGTLFSDGTFEFRGVLPGLHSIAALGSSNLKSLGALIVAGDRDIQGVEIEPIAVVPVDVRQPVAPGPVGRYAPGTVLAPASLKGRVIEEASGKPIEEGTIKLIGGGSAVAPIGPGGEFEFARLLPGAYDLEVRIFGHSNVLQSIVVGDEETHVDVKTLRLY
jgi:hypothetical protein